MSVITAFISLSQVRLVICANRMTFEPSRSPLCLLLLLCIQSHIIAAESLLLSYHHKYATDMGTFKWGCDGKLFAFWQILFKVRSRHQTCSYNLSSTRTCVMNSRTELTHTQKRNPGNPLRSSQHATFWLHKSVWMLNMISYFLWFLHINVSGY